MDQDSGDLIMSPAESATAVRKLVELPPLCQRLAFPIEPGHVMSHERYRKLVEEQQK